MRLTLFPKRRFRIDSWNFTSHQEALFGYSAKPSLVGPSEQVLFAIPMSGNRIKSDVRSEGEQATFVPSIIPIHTRREHLR